MKKIISKSILMTSFFLLIVLIIVYNFIYNPLYKALEETSLENFVNITETSKTSFEYIIERGVENSKSISSRTMIKNKIIEYKDGTINLKELKNYTQPRYDEGIQVFENLVYSARIVDDKIIASSGKPLVNVKAVDMVDELVYEIFKEKSKIYLLVYSPIKSSEIVGMDMIVYDLSSYLPEIELGDMTIDIIKQGDIAKYQDQMTINPLVSEYNCSDNIVYLNVFYELADHIFLHISIPKDTFYYDFDSVTKASFKNLILVFIFSFISINGIIILIASKKITTLDRSNEKYKQDSYYDTLTGAYSRLFLNKWLKSNSNKKLDYAIVFIDMNNFKEINDKYGHNKGDEVLKEVISTFKNEIRQNDFIVRFGGDEFIVLLECISKNTTIKTLERINNNLKLPTISSLEISFSYGIGKLTNTANFYDVLEEIDNKMYEMKKNRV